MFVIPERRTLRSATVCGTSKFREWRPNIARQLLLVYSRSKHRSRSRVGQKPRLMIAEVPSGPVTKQQECSRFRMLHKVRGKAIKEPIDSSALRWNCRLRVLIGVSAMLVDFVTRFHKSSQHRFLNRLRVAIPLH